MKLGEPGSVIASRFQIVAQVASGGMGTVHRAFDMQRQKAVAIKLMTDVGSTEAADRFRREANVLAELRHPGIVEFVDAGLLDDGGMYLAMQWLEGFDLAHRLVQGPLSIVESVTVVKGVAEALAVAHGRGVLHRDVKPQNVFLREGDIARPVLLDFGIASLVGMLSGITRTGLTIGTPGYMSPEQARGERTLDARVDVYGLGCLLFLCLTGSPPFVGPTPIAIVAEVLLSTAPRLRSRLPDAPEELDQLVAAMLAKNIEERPRDGLAVADRLREILVSLAPSSRAPAMAVSAEERRMVALVRVAIPKVTTKKPKGTIPMRGTFLPKLAAEHRAEIQPGPGGASFLIFTSDDSIIEAAARAGAAALATVTRDPELLVSLALGPSRTEGGIDRQLVERLGAMATTSGKVIADATARSLMLAKFVFAQVEGGFHLVSERKAEEAAKHTPFVGRDREIRALTDAFEAVAEEGSARAGIVVGAPGLGKSRLVRELYVRLEQRSPAPAVIDARAEPVRKDAPLALLGQLVRRGLTVVDGAQPEEQTVLLRAALADLVPPAELDRVTAFLAIAADLPPAGDAVQAEVAAATRDPQLLEDQISRAFCAVLRGLGDKHRHVVLMIDDAHYADPVSARVLGRSVKRLQDQAVALFAFARPEMDDRLALALRDVPIERIQLGGLPKKAAEKLARAAMGDKATDEAIARIVHQADGSPLFVQELASFATEKKKAATGPTGVLASLESKMLRLEPTARKILRAASVFGETFWQGGVATLLGEGSAEAASLAEWLVFLVDRDIVAVRRTTRFARETELTFRHALMRDVALAMLTPEDRAKAHRLAATWLETVGEREPAVLATHLEAAGDPAAAAVHWARAGRLAYERNDAPRAVEWIEHALRGGIGGRDRAEALVVLTNALTWMGLPDRAEQRGTEALASFLPGTQGWVEAASALIRPQSRRDDNAALELLRKLVEAVRRDPSLRPIPETLSLIIPLALRHGDAALASGVVDVLGQAALAHAPQDPGVRASILRCRSWQAMFAWDYAACVAYDTEALECFRRAGDLRQACQAYFDLGFDLLMLGDYERSQRTMEEALAEARRLGVESLELVIEHNLSFCIHRLGRSAEAIAIQKKCIESAISRKDRTAEAHARRALAIILHEIGEEGAEAELERVLAFPEAISFRWDVLARLGLIALAKGNLALARLRITDAMRGLGELKNAEEGDMVIRLAAIEMLRTIGDTAGAHVELTRAKQRLMLAAERIQNAEVRSAFLTRIPEHARILELAASP